MIKNNGKKLKSAIVVLALLLTALTVSMFGSVSAIPGGFGINTPFDSSYIQVGSIVTITWDDASLSDPNVGYNVTINGAPIETNISVLTYDWDTDSYATGLYLIGVKAFNWTNGQNHVTRSSTNNVTVYLVDTPGVTAWGNATTELVFDVSYTTVTINSSKWSGAGPFYLYFPTYRSGGTGGNANTFTWDGPYQVSGYNVRIANAVNSATLDTAGSPITFNRSGMYIFDNDGTHAGNDPSSYAGYIWVNASDVYSIESVSDFKYGDSVSKTITVNTGTDTGCMISIMGPDNSTIYNKWRATGVTEAIGTANFPVAGEYTVKAYRDGISDAFNSTYYYPDEDNENYSEYYGSNYTGKFPWHTIYAGEKYNYTHMGPWDPPEKNAAEETFTVTTGEPNIVLTNTTIYWGFEARIDINITNSTGKGISGKAKNIGILNSVDESPVTWLKWGHAANNTLPAGGGSFAITEIAGQPGNYSFNISRGAAHWKNLYNKYANGTWYVYYIEDINSDGTDEWNDSKDFQVSGTPPSARIVIDNDGFGKANDKKVDVPVYTGGGVGPADTINVVFTIFGNTVTGAITDYYGDDAWEDWKNISITGDILYPMDGTTLTNVVGTWTAVLTPTRPGGTINIKVTWNTTNTVLEETINIINGSTVTTSTDVIYVGEHTNLTVYVKDMDGDPVKTATVYLFEKGLGTIAINSTTGNNGAGNGKDGAYTFWILPTNFTEAPDNITIAAMWTTGRWGYANVKVEKQHNMIVNVTPTTSYAGDGTEYTVTISLIGGGAPKEDNNLWVKLYNETGALVTSTADKWEKQGDVEFKQTKPLSGGTYYLYAYNKTHDSRGNNATIIVTPYSVESNPAMLAWLIDTKQNITFQVTPAGNGTLILKNMTGLPNCSAVNQKTSKSVINGIATITNVNATTLGNVTYEYLPNGGAQRPAEGLLVITTAVATPNPPTIYTNDGTTEVIITVTHPATNAKLEGVRVSLDNNKNATTSILAKIPDAEMTDANGIATFGLMPQASGEITIYLKNGSDPNNEYIITSATRKTMTLSHAPSVDEGDTFTVTALYNSEPITDTKVTITFNGFDWTTTTGVVDITAPADLEESYDWPLVANAEGYTLDVTSLIRVINKPNLYLTITETTWKSGTKYVVKPYADNGAYGITVLLKDASGVTVDSQMAGPDGATFTAPEVKAKTTYTITATKTGYVSSEPVEITIEPAGIPGFELITLIAAIGVAFILLRRRRK